MNQLQINEMNTILTLQAMTKEYLEDAPLSRDHVTVEEECELVQAVSYHIYYEGLPHTDDVVTSVTKELIHENYYDVNYLTVPA